MKYAIIENGTVVNITESATPLFDNWIESNAAEIGDIYENGHFSKPSLNLDAKSAEVRAKRNKLLNESDWTQLIDAKVNQATWAVYRQSLRDITLQVGFPWDITWPDSP